MNNKRKLRPFLSALALACFLTALPFPAGPSPACAVGGDSPAGQKAALFPADTEVGYSGDTIDGRPEAAFSPPDIESDLSEADRRHNLPLAFTQGAGIVPRPLLTILYTASSRGETQPCSA